jgi:predicted dehydrogenase
MDPNKTIGVGMLGYAFMGKAHTNAFKKLPYFYYPPPATPVLQGICGRNAEAVQEAAIRFGYRYATTEWQKLIDDPDISLFDNNGPNNVHKDPCIAALQAGKHTIVEKPLAMDVAEARDMDASFRRVKSATFTTSGPRFSRTGCWIPISLWPGV